MGVLRPGPQCSLTGTYSCLLTIRSRHNLLPSAHRPPPPNIAGGGLCFCSLLVSAKGSRLGGQGKLPLSTAVFPLFIMNVCLYVSPSPQYVLQATDGQLVISIPFKDAAEYGPANVTFHNNSAYSGGALTANRNVMFQVAGHPGCGAGQGGGTGEGCRTCAGNIPNHPSHFPPWCPQSTHTYTHACGHSPICPHVPCFRLAGLSSSRTMQPRRTTPRSADSCKKNSDSASSPASTWRRSCSPTAAAALESRGPAARFATAAPSK